MCRKAFCFGLIGLLLFHVPASADTSGRSAAAPAKARSISTQDIWTLVGIGAGFGAGFFIGLNSFDDPIKVWTSAIVGAVGGGVAGGLLSRNVGRAPQVKATGSIRPATELRLAPWTSAGPSTSEDDELLRRRVRELALR